MLNTDEKAISLFNSSLKQCEIFGIATNKRNAVEISLLKLTAIKEALYDSTLIDDSQVKKTLEYYCKVQRIIESL